MINKLPHQQWALNVYSRVFGGDALLDSTLAADNSDLAQVYSEFDGKLWGLQEEQVVACMRQIPEESLEKCSLQQFVEEYEGFRAWLQSLKSTPFVREFYKLVRCRLQVASGTSATSRVSFWVSPAGIREATDDNFIPKSGAFVHSRKHGRCQVMEVETRICNTRLHRYVMTTPYMEIHCRKIWHVVRAYHRCTLLAVPSESLAWEGQQAQGCGVLHSASYHTVGRVARPWW